MLEWISLTNINVVVFRKNIFSLLEKTIKFKEPVKISTKDGNAVLMSESDYNDIMATLEIFNNPKLHKKIADGLGTHVSDCISADELVDIRRDSYGKVD